MTRPLKFRRPAPTQGGFTLLEMLIALAALSLLMVMLSGSVQFGSRAWEGQSRRVKAYTETDAVHSVLRDMLRNARPTAIIGYEQVADGSGAAQPAGTQPQTAAAAPIQAAAAPQAPGAAAQGPSAAPPSGERKTGNFLIGGRDTIDFVSELPEQVGAAGLYDIKVWLQPDGRLTLSWRRHVRLATGVAPRYEDTELLANVAAVEFSFFKSDGKQAGRWQSTWTDPGVLPALVLLRVQFNRGDARIWREMKVAPVLGSVVG